MFKITDNDTLKQDKKCQPCCYIVLSTMSGSTTPNANAKGDYKIPENPTISEESVRYMHSNLSNRGWK